MNFLRGCPALRELRLKSSWHNYLCATVQDPVIQATVVSDFTSCGSINYDDVEHCCEGLELLTELNCRCGLDCLRSSLRIVALEFDTEELSSFQIHLLKFSTCYTEDIVVDGGMGYDSSCVVRKVAGWKRDAPCRLVGKEGDHSVCYHCYELGRMSSSSSSSSLSLSADPPSLWTPSLSEFLPVEASACST
ncbi:hypothetical protein D1007_47348 [Hordeum vulgare]|nr:hypothetical protein D1007_47348 [Hordeum vulgare]